MTTFFNYLVLLKTEFLMINKSSSTRNYDGFSINRAYISFLSLVTYDFLSFKKY